MVGYLICVQRMGILTVKYFKFDYIHCDPLMMQQKEARRKHTCMLPKKVAYLVWFSNSVLIGNDGCYLRASCMLPACFLLYYIVHSRKHAGSTHHFPCFFKAKLDGNSQHFAYFSRKHAGSTHGCYLRASFCFIINGSYCTLKYAYEILVAKSTLMD